MNQVPYDEEVELAVLGQIINIKGAYEVVSHILNEDCFYVDAHKILFRCIKWLNDQNAPIDILTVTNAINQNGYLNRIGGPYFLAGLSEGISYENIENYANILHEKSLRRNIITLSQSVLTEAYNPASKVEELIDKYEKQLTQSTANLVEDKVLSANDLHKKLLERNAKIVQNNGKLIGVPSKFIDLDSVTGGWTDPDLIILAGRPAMGKCLGLGTKVIMFDGTIKKVEDVVVGDKLMGPDSTHRNVLSITRGVEKMYWIRQNKGIDYRVNESHILSLKASGSDGTRKHGSIINIPVKEFIQKSNKFQIRHKGYKSPIEFLEQNVPIDPYFLGLWLGDGNCDSIKIHNPDKEIIEYLYSMSESYGMSINNHSKNNSEKCPCWYISSPRGDNNIILDVMRQINVINNKHIPHIYIKNSRKNRLKLLAGLLDTDGFYQQKENIFEIIQINETLSNDIKFLCHSLGFGCTMKKVKKQIKSIGFEGDYFKIIISGNLDEIPTLIKRKQARYSNLKRDVLVTGIKVEADIIDDYYGFEIDGDRLFLLEDTTVTHNTAIAIQFASNPAVDENIPTAIFSLEMSSLQLYSRMQSQQSGIISNDINKKGLNDLELLSLNLKLSAAPIYIDDTPNISVFELRQKCRKLKREKGIQLIIIDYLQLMTAGKDFKGSREQEVGYISRSLKGLAKELKIPVIAISSLSRGVESRGSTDHKPKLSDLRESGSIESDADIVIFVHRPEYYGIKTDANGNSTKGKAELIIAKHRSGSLAEIPLRFEHAKTLFSDYKQDGIYQHEGPTF